MLTYVDRMQLAVNDRNAAAETFRDILGAEVVREDKVDFVEAERTVVQAGISEFELLQPTGDGKVQQHLDAWGEGLFAAGFSSPELSALAERLTDHNVTWWDEGEQIFVEPDQTPGLRMVLSPEEQRSPVGLISFLYEATNLIDDHQKSADFYADAFGLDKSRFSPITSDQYGYTGQLTLFDPPDRLDRIELSEITDYEKAMGRFKTRRGGECLYMCYVEAPDVHAIAERLEARKARWAGRADDPNLEGLFIHPTALHGTLMGVSRTNLAWRWSGRPELAKAPA
jgi:catechol 2,3-dioxygenase-like lactoylglutathione lyase family enzyme